MSFNGVENALLEYAIDEINGQLRELGILEKGQDSYLGNCLGIRYKIVEETRKLTAFKDGLPIDGLVPVNCYNYVIKGDLATIVDEFMRWRKDPSKYGCDFFTD
jgi:hypothetical protein